MKTDNYKTREAAIQAVKTNGKNLAYVDDAWKDDEEIVELALKNGGSIFFASPRIRNQLSFIIKQLECDPQYVLTYEQALFVAENDENRCKTISQSVFFKENDPFQMELRLFYGEKYKSSINKYNTMDCEQLRDELKKYQIKEYHQARKFYKEACGPEDFVRVSESLDRKKDHYFLRDHALLMKQINLPFSGIADFVEKNSSWAEEKEKIEDYISKNIAGSYPERFISSLLKTLGVDYAREQTFDWSTTNNVDGRKTARRYDFYVPALSAIIEVHGAQHYEGGFEALGGRTLQEEQENDCYKEQLAKENGIKHYIVIDASNSSPQYLEKSIVSNPEFISLFNITSVNWKQVSKGTKRVVSNDTRFPLFEDWSKRMENWLQTIQEANVTSDPEIDSLRIAEEHANELLQEKLKKAVPSRNGLYPHELSILNSASSFSYPIDGEMPFGHFFYEFGIKNLNPYFKKLIDLGFVEYADIKTCISHYTLPDIKRALIEKNLPTKGKKQQLMDMLFENFSDTELREKFPQKYLALTEKGEQELIENEYIKFEGMHGLNAWDLNILYHVFNYMDAATLIREYNLNPSRFSEYLSNSS